MSHLTYTDQDGNEYELVYHPYVPNTNACDGCAFVFGNSLACCKAKSCTPRDTRGRLVTAGFVWKLKTINERKIQ
jgi:hypothetical protein